VDIARSRRLILIAAAAALIVRLAFGLIYWTGKPMTHDEHEYLALADSLRHGQGLHYPADHESGAAPRFGRAPGYPAFLALLATSRDVTSAPARVKIVQSVLGGIAVWMIGTIALSAAGGRAGVIAAWIAAFYPPLVWIPAYVFSESLFMPIAFGCAMLLAAARARAEAERSARGGGAMTVAAGLTAGVAILVRPAMLLFLPVVALWFILQKRWSLALAFCVAAAAVVAPWTLRNAREYARFVLVASEGGVTFWTGNHPLSTGEGDLAANPMLKQAEVEFRQSHPGLTAEQLEPLYYRDALSRIRSNFGWWIGLVGRKLWYTFVPAGPSYALHSTRYRLGSVIPYVLLAPFAFAGFTRLVRRGGAATPLLLLAVAVVVTGLIFFPQERFRTPVLDPTLIVCASVVLAESAVSRGSRLASSPRWSEKRP
jgi:4-amino-4-deoxy-L-arabinose transferase-like glycosyltransferase